MYNHMNGPVAGGSGLLSLPLPQGENSTTPRTPEILNSLIAMTNPFESSYRAHAPRLASSPPGGSDTSTSSSGSPGCTSPPSVQHTCSQLIKEGLKLTIQSKRRQSQRAQHGEDGKQTRCDEVSGDHTADDDDDDPFSPRDGLTPEDEERRKRRRERNKIAATKCRLKKRERTVNLVHESEILESQNHELKSQIQELETQRRRLIEVLSVHGPRCSKTQQGFPAGDNSAAAYSANFSYPRGAVDSGATHAVFRRANVNSFPRSSTSVIDTTMTYHKVETITCTEPYQRMDAVIEETYCRPSLESTVYHNFQSQEKDISLQVPYCRSSVINSVETAPSFTRISEQYPCQMTNPDPFVKPEIPPMASFHSPASSYGQPSSLDMTHSVSPGYENVNSPGLVSSATPYQTFPEERDTFATTFSSTDIDHNCLT